jgi:hypothetical protein
MAHYAKVLDGKVIKVIVAEEDFFNTFVDDSAGEWVQTSYNTLGNQHKLGGTPLRKNFAGVGFHYDGTGFYEPKPYNSWTLNNTTYLWEAPLTKPDGNYIWDEDAYQADNTKGWVAYTPQSYGEGD